jgi:LysM repeat protein
MPSPTPTATPTPKATPKPTPKPTSGRFALLTPCPSTPDCYVYVIRSGDNLFSIANYFGVSLTRVQKMNPWVSGGLVVGHGLRIPTPTR